MVRDPFSKTKPSHPDTKTLLDSLDSLSDMLRQPLSMAPELASNLQIMVGRMREAADKLNREWLAQQREQEELRALVEVSQAVNSTLDLAAVLNQVMDHIIVLTGAERSFLMLFDEAGELQFKVARNLDKETIIAGSSFEISRTIVKTVASEGQPVVTTNAQADPRFSSQESVIGYNLRSILCVPLRVRAKITGVIYADSRIRTGLFGDADRDLLATFANQAALAIENARLFEQVKEQLDQISEMKALMDNVFSSIPSGVISTDVADKITLFNRSAETILGMPSYRAIQQPFRVLPIKERLGAMVQDVKRKDRPAVAYEDLKLPGRGMVNLSLSVAPLKDPDNATMGVAIVVDDLTEKKKLEAKREVFRRMVSPTVFATLPDNPEELKLGGSRREITVFFADIRNFTPFSEKLAPERLIEVLNQYLKIGADAVLAQEGTLDKFIGDQIMGIFNAPNDLPDHTFRAVRAALTMQKAIAAYSQNRPESERLSFGIGVNFGNAVVGYIGTQDKSDYTAVGDVVNYGKRLQENARGGQVLLSQAAYERVKDRVVANALEPIQVKGRTAKESVCEVVALR